MIRKAIITVSVATLVSTAAVAADLNPAPVDIAPISPTYSWTGGYIGAHLGWGWDQADWTITNGTFWGPVGGAARIKDDGFLGGIQGGYLHQSNNLVFGFDLSASGTDISESIVSPYFPGIDTWSSKVSWLFLAQARLGWGNDQWLAFLQGGYAGGDAEATMTVGPPFGPYAVSDSNWQNGWTIGGGVLFRVSDRFSVGGEYSYVDLGNSSYSLPGTFGGPQAIDIDHQIHVVKLTGNLHFNGP